jgi:hypothetical protein
VSRRLKLGGVIIPLSPVPPCREQRHFDSVQPAVQKLAQDLHGAYSVFVVVHGLYTAMEKS